MKNGLEISDSFLSEHTIPLQNILKIGPIRNIKI